MRALAQLSLANARRGVFQTLQVAPVRAHPEQQAAEQGSADQDVDTPVQQIHFQRIRGHHPLDGLLPVQRRDHQGAPAPVADAYHALPLLQLVLLLGGELGVVDGQQVDAYGFELGVQIPGKVRPLPDGELLKLFDQQGLHAPRHIGVVADETLMEQRHHQFRHGIDGSSKGNRRYQIQTKQELEHGLNIPTRSG